MSAPLRPNVCMLLFNIEGKIFLGERAGEPGHWQLPQGGVDEDSTRKESVIRELEEELGLPAEKIRIVKRLRTTHEYEWEEERKYGGKRYRGQAQTFWIVEFLGKNEDINIETEHPEFINWKWCSTAEIRTIAAPIRQPSYILPLREFEDFLLLRDTGLMPEDEEQGEQ